MSFNQKKKNSNQAFDDLELASVSSIDFWDNTIDDEVWNNYKQGEILIIPVPSTNLSNHDQRS